MSLVLFAYFINSNILRTLVLILTVKVGLLNAGADIFFVDYLAGHTIPESQSAYYRADPDALKKKYMKYLPFLAIENTEVHTIESEEYRQLREENEQIKQQFDQLKSSMRQEFAQLVDSKVNARINQITD